MTRISVTAKDVRLGEKLNSKECPVNRAIRRRVRNDYKVYVGDGWVTFWNFDSMDQRKVRLPVKVWKFTRSFDHGVGPDPKPMTFELGIPEDILK